MASGEDTAITTQPRSKRKELEQFVRDLDPIQVVGKWKESEHYLAMRAAAPSVYQLSAIRKLVPYHTLVNAIQCRPAGPHGLSRQNKSRSLTTLEENRRGSYECF